MSLDSHKLNDRTLLERLTTGDNRAFEILYFRYAPKIRSFLKSLRLSSHEDDVIQDTFIAVWKNRSKIDVNRSFDNYLFTIAKNFSLKALKAQLRFELARDNYLYNQKIESTDSRLIISEIADQVQKAVDNLPDRPKEVFKLRRDHGLSTQQIADRLNVSTSTVENHMNKALNMLRKVISPSITLSALLTAIITL